MHLYTLAYMSMHESCLLVCRPCFNTVKLWTFNPNLHLSPVDTTFCCLLTCLPSRLFACLLAFLLICLLVRLFVYLVVCHVSCHILCLLRLYACLLYTHCALSAHLFLFIACLLVLVFAFACTHTGQGRMELGHNLPSASKKGHGYKHVVKPSGSVQ